MNLTSTLVNQHRRSRPLGAAPAAVAILYPKVGNVLRVPLRRTRPGGRAGCEQHPERQFIVWFNRMAAARPGFPMQIKSILLITGQPLCASCQRALFTYLSRYYLADKLRVRSAAPSCNCGCGGKCRGAADAYTPREEAVGRLVLDSLLTNPFAEEFELENELSKEQKAVLKDLIAQLAENLRQGSYAGKTKSGRSGDPVKAQVQAQVGAELKRIGNSIGSQPALLARASNAGIGSKELAQALKDHGEWLIGKANQSRHVNRRELEFELPDNELAGASCPSPGPARPTLRYGARGELVRYLQCRLNYQHANLPLPLVEDGVWGPKTQAAVQSFQQSRGLAVDAVVGPLTWAQLDAGSPVVPTVPPRPTPGGPAPGLGLVRFRNAADIDAYFRARTGQDFVDWFQARVGGRGAWQGRNLGGLGLKDSFRQFWDNIPAIFSSPDINFAQFAALQSIATNETGNMRPIAEMVGSMGLAYPFNVVRLHNGSMKGTYNRSPNRTAYDLFRDGDYIRAHGQKALGSQLANTTDQRWAGSVYPAEFPTDPAPGVTGFIREADFFKFRGRGFIQTTWRGNYLNLVRYVQAYAGNDPVIRRYRQAWQGLTPDVAATVSSNQDWDALFQQSQEFALRALKIFFDRARGARPISSIDGAQVGNWSSVRAVAIDVAGTRNTSYHDLFERRVRQIFDTLDASPVPGGSPGALPVPGGGVPLPIAPTSATEAEQRDAIVANALRMMAPPPIHAKQRGADGFRQGWQKLKAIFELAAPAFIGPGWEENNLKRSLAVSNTAGIPHWCGIFAVWATRAAGRPVGTWQIGTGIARTPGFRSITPAQVKRGDIGYINQPYQHHFIVREVNPDGTIDTIDGNSAGTSTVSTKSRVPMRNITGFFSAF